MKMKNLLAENMVRFGTKNLSKSEQSKLQRLHEQPEDKPDPAFPETNAVEYISKKIGPGTKTGWKIDDSMEKYGKMFIHNGPKGVDSSTKSITVIRPQNGKYSIEVEKNKKTKTYNDLFSVKLYDTVIKYALSN